MMSEGVLLDNDVVLKLSIYRSVDDMIKATTLYGIAPSILGVAKFTLRSHVQRSRSIHDREAVMQELQKALGVLNLLEPNAEELQMAADLEQAAIEGGLDLDAGESQLYSILLKRRAPLMITGDKRAIRALRRLTSQDSNPNIACIEQLVSSIISIVGYEILRRRVCAEPRTDRALTAIFACSSETASLSNVIEGLQSYIRHLRHDADGLLLPSDDLSAIVA